MAIQRLIKLKDIIFFYIESSKLTEAEFLRLWRIAFRGFEQMGLNAFWEPLTVALPVQPSKVAILPPNYLKWIKIGQFNWQGELQTLRVNEQLTTYKDNDPNRLNQITPEIQSALCGDNWYGLDGIAGVNGGSYTSEVSFSRGSHLVQFGECKVDEQNNVIILNPKYEYAQVILEYLCSPEKNDDYQIPLEFQEAMIAWLAWQDIVHLPATGHVGNNAVSMRARTFRAQLGLAKKMFKPFRLQEAMQYIVEGETLAIK
jgi:hypothetical protein